MKTATKTFTIAVIMTSIFYTSCEKEQEKPDENETTFSNVKAPYLICANRNPGGIGFDFKYNDNIGGANNLDSLSVEDFAYDIKVRTIKGEKPDGSLGGAPFIQLHESVQAINYSSIDTTCKGIAKFSELQSEDLLAFDWQYDNSSFDLSNLSAGETGNPYMSDLIQEFQKLVIGEAWKTSANNTVENDEIVWLIKTRENEIVKFIVTDFPANPAPTSTGYINAEWAFIE